jgi:phosphoribosylformylglycinamidine (FGAM) synthase-like amidotransferase family enzyme
MKLAIVIGEGIECEKETAHFFSKLAIPEKIEMLPVKELVSGNFDFANYKAGDLVFLPGGFSFADHFGAGKLLAYWLKQAKVFERIEEKGLHVMGVCNGFQMLCAAGIFGEGVSLEPNLKEGRRLGFVNRWVKVKVGDWLATDCELRLPVRHGEGRLLVRKFEENVKPFLSYADPNFENGSHERIAGLMAKRGKSTYWGMMPHPEIALRPLQDPDVAGPEYFPKFRHELAALTGDGVKLIAAIMKHLKETQPL